MRTEFIYSVAALAAVPVVANADAEAFKASAVQTVTTSDDVELPVGTLAKGEYTLKINAITIANAASGDKLTVKLMAGDSQIGSWQVASGKSLNKTFSIASETTNVKIVLVHGEKQVTVPAPVITLNFDFAAVADKLQIECLKLTTAMAVLEDYPEKTTDADTYTALYNRISAIRNATYDSYKNDLEGLQALFNGQTGDNYQSLGIYTDLLSAMSTVNGHIYAELCTSDKVGMGVDVTTRYNALADIYKSNALNEAKQAYEEAQEAYNNEGTRTAVYKLQPLKDALEAFLTQVKAQEEVKATNEAAKTQMDNALKAVYNSANPTDANSYYGGTALEAFKLYTDDTDATRYDDLKADAQAALAALVGNGSNNAKYQAAVNAINEAYNNLTIKEESVQKSINSLIAAFKEQITQVVTEYNGYFGTLKSAYATYDGEKAAADELTADAADFLLTYKGYVDGAVAELKTLIENNDTKANIGNLTDDAIQGKVTAIETEKATYTTKKGIYDDWQAMLTELGNYTTTLNTNETAIKNYAKTTKQVPESDYDVAAIWASVKTNIQGLISTATTNVNNNKTNATTYKASRAYKNAKARIEEALESYVANAKAATDLFARIYTAHKNAKTTYDDIYDIDGIQEYKVWNNQVTIDDAVKARTPYLSVLNDINDEIGNWAGKMAEAKTKEASEHLSWLEENTPESVLTDEQATLDAIKANYTTDEQLFETQLVYMDMDALKLQINSKASQLETSIAPYETKITNGEYGNVGKNAVQEEITKLKRVIEAAKAEAAKENDKTTKDELSAQWTRINSLTLTDLEEASQTAIENYTTFTTNKNRLVGEETDDQNTITLNGLNKYYTKQKNDVQGCNYLTDAQKEAKKTAIDNAEVTVTEDGQQVKYTLASLTTAINNATQEERLTEAEVTRYQGVISNLRSAALAVAVQAGILNEMERRLSLVDFTTAKAAVKAADANEQGYYYTLLTGTDKAGQYQYDFNALKNEIEAQTNFTNDIVDGYTDRIDAIKDLLNAVAGKAAQCKTAYDGANSYLNETETLLQNGITEYSKDKWKSSVQAQNLTVLQGYAASDGKIAGLRQAILDQYNNGALESTASVNGVNNTALRIEIQILLDQYMNESTYNAQVQADNDAIYERVQAAENEAKLAQKTAADYINAYRNLKSTELKGVLEDPVVKAANDAVVELLYSFEATTNAITQQAAQEYADIVSPAHYDEKGEASIAKYGEVVDNLTTAVAAFTAAISNTYGAVIQNSIDTYAAAISDAKAKVKTYTTDEGAKKSNREMNTLFGGIDNMQRAITDNFISEPENIEQLTENLKALDDALYAAEDADNGILAEIKNVKETEGKAALLPFFADWGSEDSFGYIANNVAASNRDFFNDNLTEAADVNDYWDYHYKVRYQDASTWIDDFATMKARLYEIKAAAEKNYAENAAKLATITAINTTATKLAGAYTTCYSYVAGAQVKAGLDAIQQNLSQYPTDKVTPANAEEWAEKVAAIDASIDEWKGTLYTAVVASIPTLVQEANDAYITFVANHDGTDQRDIIDRAETSFDGVKAAVNDGTKTIDEALADLRNIENALVNVTTVMRIANNNDETPNADVTLYNELMQKYNELDNANTLNGFRDEVVDEYSADKAAIDAQLTVLYNYLTTNRANIKVYHANALAMINDIEADIQTMIGAAQALQQQLDEEDAQAALSTLERTWRQAQNAINNVNEYIAFMESQLAQYGSTSKYANKIAQLKSQMAEVQGIYDEAYAEAETKSTTRQKQSVANRASRAINTAISNYDVETNCDEIIALAKTAYVTEKVEAMAAEIAAITWNAANYTTSDQTKLNNKKDGIIDNVGGKKSNADVVATIAAYYYTGAINLDRAEDVVYNGYINRGVISTLANYKANFDEAVAELKQMLKDMSLEAEVKGHITGGDNISAADVAALTNLIANQQEGSIDLERGDVNGDGRITVTDIIWLQYFSAFGEWPDGTTNARAYGDVAEGINSVSLETIAMGDVTRIAVKLDNERAFRAFQIGLQLPAGAEVVAESLGERVANGYLMRTEAGEGMVRFMTISDIATPFAGNEGAVLYIDVKGMTGSAQLTEAYFSDTMYNEADLTATGNQTTGIAERITNAIDSAAQKVYNLGGRLMEGVKKGINIIRNADGTTTKVVKK